jgi:chromate transporter
MTDIILHHYDTSPYAEKVRTGLGLKGVAWASVELPVIMPKPNLTALTGGYRATSALPLIADMRQKGLASLPVIQDSLVTQYHVLTNDQLNDAVVITRSSPGPVGLYIVSVGYFVAGLPGAVAGWLAMITPALLIIPLVYFVGRKMEHPKVKSVLQAVIIASAGLLLAAAIPLRRDGLTGPVTVGIALVSFVLLLITKLDTLWIILGAALVSLSVSSLGLIQQL